MLVFDREQVKQKYHINDDLLPTTQDQRIWTKGNYATTWMGNVHNIPSYVTIGGFFALGLSIGQVFWVIMISSIIISAMLVLNGGAGVKYGIGFSMSLRTAYGTRGAVIPGFLRGCISAIMWFSLQTYAGSSAVTILIGKIWPGYLHLGGSWSFFGIDLSGIISFLLFWAVNVAFVFGGMDVIGKFQKILSILIYVVFIGMAVWAIYMAGGIGPILEYTSKGIEGNTFLVLGGAVGALVATWAAPIVSINDLTRISRKPSDSAIGHPLGLILTFLLFAVASIAIIVGSEVAFGTPIWNIVDVIDRFNSTYAIAGSVFVICLATISANLVGNLVPAGYQLAALFHKKLNFKTGAMIAATIALLLFPWKLMENSTSIYGFLSFVGAILGPVTGIMMADYYVIRRRRIDLNKLYNPKGYNFGNGYHVSAIVITFVAAFVTLSGAVVEVLDPLYEFSWFIGTGLAFVLYLIFTPKQASKEHQIPEEDESGETHKIS